MLASPSPSPSHDKDGLHVGVSYRVSVSQKVCYLIGEESFSAHYYSAIDIDRWAYMIDHLFPESAEHATDNLFDAGKLKAPRR